MKTLLMATVVLATQAAWASTTIDSGNQYAYGANMGWINSTGDGIHGAVVGQAFCSGYMYGANVGWIHLGSGAPVNGMAYGNGSASDYGVNHDGLGSLTGYAYGANIGWINFEQTYGRPKVNLVTGDLGGYAWGANVGWINLSSLATLTFAAPDSDNDGIPDAWEYAHANTLVELDKNGKDSDDDGISDVDKYGADTDPFDAGDYLVITDFQIEADTNIVAWTCSLTRLYTLQYAAALSNAMSWVDTGSSFVPPAGPEIAEMVLGVADTNRFYRVQVQPPLSP